MNYDSKGGEKEDKALQNRRDDRDLDNSSDLRPIMKHSNPQLYYM